MQASDLPDLRRVARSGAVTYSKHAHEQMMNRDISTDDIENILSSNTNQLIEVQSPSCTPGMEHRDERDLIYDPNSNPDAIVVITLLFTNGPSIRVITTELPDEKIWEKNPLNNPALTRKQNTI